MQYIDDIIKQVSEIEKNTFIDYWDEESIRDTLKWEYNHLLAALKKDASDMNLKSADDGLTEGILLCSISGGADDISCECKNELQRVEDSTQGITVVGYAIYSVVADESELYRIAVDEKYRALGYGNELIKKYLQIISGRADKSFLEVRAGNNKAIELYKKNQYKKIASRKNYYNNPQEDAYIYGIEFP